MNRISLLFVVVIFLCLFQSSPASQIVPSEAGEHFRQSRVLPKNPAVKPDLNFGNIPLYFIHNKGQVNRKALYYARTPAYTLWVTKQGLVFDSVKKESESDSLLMKRDVSRLYFVGSNPEPGVMPVKPAEHRVNYFKGKDKDKWVRNVPTSAAVLYKNVYKNIDLKVYGIGKEIEYDWIVHPGGNPAEIRFEYKNVKRVEINRSGDLDITTEFGKLKHKKPFSYQHIVETDENSLQKEIVSKFRRISNTIFGFSTGKYDQTKTLVIDPLILHYSSHYGGTTNSYAGNGQNWGVDIAVDEKGVAYVAAQTTSIDFPVLNEYDSTFDGDIDGLLLKIDTTRSGSGSLLYSTYFGGTDYEWPQGICVDNSGKAYIAGHTNSLDYPVRNAYQAQHYQTNTGGYIRNDGFLICIDTTVSGSSGLVYSTYLGGDDNDYLEGISGGANGIVYLSGYSASTDFPLVNQYQSDQPSDDVIIAKIDTTQSGTASLLYSTYLGGTSWEWAHAVASDSNGNVYVTGVAGGDGFPLVGEYQARQGDWDAFVAKIDTTQSGSGCLVYSTYLGGSDHDEKGYGIAVDGNGYIYVTGYTRSNDFPLSNQYQSLPGSSWDAFLAKLDPSAGTAGLLYSTYLGGGDSDTGNSVEVDNAGNACLTGATSSTDFPVSNEYMLDQTYSDVFVTKINTLSTGADSLIWSTYLGGNSGDEGIGIDVDSDGRVYITGETQSTDFPMENEYTSTPSGSSDMFVFKISPNPLTRDYSVRVKASAGGIVDKEYHLAMEGTTVTVHIYPHEGYEIDRIVDNGVEMAVSNPYIIHDIQEDHQVDITFKKILYPPVLTLTGVRKSEKAWIIEKDYADLSVSITEHESPMPVSAYVLYKNAGGVWSELKRFSGAGVHTYTDKYFKAGESVSYSFKAYGADGSVVSETAILTL